MTNKGFEAEISIAETPNFRATEDKPLKYDPKQTKKVDINVLKARVQKIQSRENKIRNSIEDEDEWGSLDK